MGDIELPVLIGITGYAQAGKTTAAAWLERMLGYEVHAFADPLRKLAERLNPFLFEAGCFYGDALDRFGYEGAKQQAVGFRQFLKDLGNGVRECVDRDAWVRACLAKCERQSVVQDVRFLNEADALRRRASDMGGDALIIRIERPGVGPESDFEREVPRIEADEVVDNDGDLDDLRDRLLRAVVPDRAEGTCETSTQLTLC